MRASLSVALLALLSFSANAEVWQARYGVAETFDFKLFNADGTLDVDEADGGTEVSVSCNEGAETTATNDFTDEGTFYSIALTAAELQCERIAVVVAATTTEVFFIQTIDNTSAMTPQIVQTGDSFARIGATGSGLTSLASQASVTTIDDFLDTEIAAILAAVDTEVAAILDDTGTTGVVIAEATANCREVLGCDTQGTLSGTHSTTTADLGTNAPANDITGMTLEIPSRNFSRAISSYNAGTGVATWTAATAVTLANSDQYYLWATAPSSGGAGGDVNVVTVEGADATTYFEALDNPALAILGSPTNFGSGATLAGNNVDIEGQTDDIGTAGAGLTAADDAVITLIGAAGAGLTAVDDAVLARLPAALISGRMAAQVGGYESGQAPLQPTVAGRTADVTATGGVGIDWANVENPTAALGLTGTTISTAQVAASVTGNVGGNVTGSVGSVATGGIVAGSIASDAFTAAKFATDVTTELQTGLATATNLATVDTVVDAIKVTTDKLDDTLEDDAGTFRFSANALEQAPTGSGESLSAIADAVWDEALSGHATGGSTGAALSSASAGGGLDAAGVRAAVGLATANLDTQLSGVQSDTNDLQTRVPAALVSGRIDASVGAMAANVVTAAAAASDLTTELQSGLATSSEISSLTTLVNAIDDFIDTEMAAVKAKTDQLTFGVSNTLNVNVEYMNAEQVCGSGDSGTPWTGC